jgi:pimeloyl-ACP methyl ester carboxylesterase
METYDDAAALPGGPRLALRRIDGGSIGTRSGEVPGVDRARRPVLLVHGLSSNARTWDGVARRLASAGHEVVAVDQRGHGHSEQSADGYTTEQCATDLARLVEVLGFTGERAPVVAGQSWGGNVVVDLAARHGVVAGLALVDGGWIRLSDRFATFDDCWADLAPPRFDEVRADELTRWLTEAHPDWPDEGLAGTLANFEIFDNGSVRPWLRREHHREIVRSLFEGDPATQFPSIGVPVLLVPVVADPPDGAVVAKRAAVVEAEGLLPDASIRWYVGADHDVHVQHPQDLADDLLRLVARVEGSSPR